MSVLNVPPPSPLWLCTSIKYVHTCPPTGWMFLAGDLSTSAVGHVAEVSLPTNFSADVRMQHDDPTALAYPYLLHVVSPPDARYFPTVAAPTTWQLTHVHAVATWAAGMHVRNGKLFSAPAESPTHFYALVKCMQKNGYWRQLWTLHVEMQMEAGERGQNATAPYEGRAQLSPSMIAAAERCRAAGHSLTTQVRYPPAPFAVLFFFLLHQNHSLLAKMWHFKVLENRPTQCGLHSF
jgi:hypothetical protein